MKDIKYLGDLVERGFIRLCTGPFGSALHKHEYRDSGISVVPAEAIVDGELDTSKYNFITGEKGAKLSRYKLTEGDIVFARRGAQACGLSALIRKSDNAQIAGTGLIYIKVLAPEAINPYFLFLSVSSEESIAWLKSHAIGATMPNLNGSVLKSLPLRIPDFERQLAIVNQHQPIVAKIRLNRETNQTLEQIAQALFKSWFVDFEPTRAKIAAKQAGHDPERAAMAAISGKTVAELDQLDVAQLAQLKTTAALFPEGLVESELGEVPEGWRVAGLDSIAKLDTTSVKPNKEPDKLWEHYSIPSFDVDQSPSYELGVEIKSNKYKVDPNSVLSSKLNPHFPRTWWPDVEDNDAAICSTEFMQFIPVVPTHRAFLQGLILSKPVQEGIMQRVTGSTGSRQRAQPKQVAVMKVVLPSTELIDLYCEKLSGMSVTKARLIKENSTLTTLRDTLLPKLLSGELSPTQAEVA